VGRRPDPPEPPRIPRTARASAANVCYHVLNRGNARRQVFFKDGDYRAFVQALREASERLPMRVLAYCLMPNHFHLAVRPYNDGDLSRWMHWLSTAHVRRYHEHYHSDGHLWQGRFKAFPVQDDDHLLVVLRYIERNPLRGPGAAGGGVALVKPPLVAGRGDVQDAAPRAGRARGGLGGVGE
jgi:putative transposase